jgi:hypothetical protein
MSTTYLNTMAWREILARVFDGLTVQANASPPWLINPATRRKLKLDQLYPEIGVAVRITGIMAKGQRRQSDWEILESEQRDQTRAELCRLNGVQLALIDPAEDPVKQLDNLLRVLSRASRLAAQNDWEPAQKRKAMDGLSKAHREASQLRTRISKKPDQMLATLAERWRDREEGLAIELQKSSKLAATAGKTPKSKASAAKKFRIGQRVQHSAFGAGVITEVIGKGDDTRISILFDGAEQRTFLASLVADKLTPIS